MKWYWWVLVAVVVIVIILFIVYSIKKKSNKVNLVTDCNNYDEVIYQEYGIKPPAEKPRVWIARKGCGGYFKRSYNCVQGQECQEQITEEEFNQIKNSPKVP